uniref:Uncharacterized protein n=1 Tax=Arundo donax TaxID=35708 RepID=A0A0A9A0B9_ARUDO
MLPKLLSSFFTPPCAAWP